MKLKQKSQTDRLNQSICKPPGFPIGGPIRGTIVATFIFAYLFVFQNTATSNFRDQAQVENSRNLASSPPSKASCPTFAAMFFTGNICPESDNGELIALSINLNIQGLAVPKLTKAKLLGGTILPPAFRDQFKLVMTVIPNSKNYFFSFSQTTPPQSFQLRLIRVKNEYEFRSMKNNNIRSIELPQAIGTDKKPITPGGLPAFGPPVIKYE